MVISAADAREKANAYFMARIVEAVKGVGYDPNVAIDFDDLLENDEQRKDVHRRIIGPAAAWCAEWGLEKPEDGKILGRDLVIFDEFCLLYTPPS